MSERTRAAKRTKFSGGLITILAGTGDKQETFNLHETLVKENSPFFAAMLDKNWKENKTKIVKLPEDGPDFVSIYVDWCYSGQVACKDLDAEIDVAALVKEEVLLARSYVFGEKIQDDAFCNAVMTALTENNDCKIYGITYSLSTRAIKVLYAGTPAGSPARQYAVESSVDTNLAALTTDLKCGMLECPDFLFDLVLKLQSRLSEKDSRSLFERRKEWFK